MVSIDRKPTLRLVTSSSSSSARPRRRITYPWKLTWRQAEILAARERFLVLVAGRRFGKTILAVCWLITQVMRAHPGALAYYVLPFRHQAKSVAWDTLLRATRDIRVAKNETELSVTLPGGRKIVLKGADDPESLEGVGLVGVVCDEFARMKFSAWEKSLRPALSDHRGRALLIGKPRGFNHLKAVFDQGHGATKVADWRAWQYRTIDGGFVSPEDIAQAERDLPPKIFRQEYMASFETLAGRVYEEFSTKYRGDTPPGHVLPAVDAPMVFDQVGIGIDWGFTHPFAAEAVGASGEKRFAVAEAYGREFSTERVGAALGTLRDRFPGARWFADPARPDLIREYSERLGVHIEPATNDVEDGLLEVMKLVHQPVPPASGGDPGEPGLLVSDACPQLITSLDGYVWDTDREGNPVERVLKKNDHAPDALRYAVMGLRDAAPYTPAPRARSSR